MFQVSGYLLLSKQESVIDFYQKRIKKILIPFVAWSVLYLLWEGYYLGGGYSFLGIIKSIIYEILTGPTFVHLWFFYALLGIYALVPILRLFVSVAKKNELWYLVVVWIFSGPLVSLFEKFSNIDIADKFGLIAGYFGYFVLGYLFSKYDYSRKQIIIFSLFYLILGAGTAIGTWYFSVEKERLFLYFYDYLSINIIVMSALFFIVVQHWGKKKLPVANSRKAFLLKKLGETSFGVYLLHEMVRISLQRGYFGFELTYKTGNPLYSIPITVLVVYLLSFFAIFLLRKIPFLRSIVW